MQQQQPLRLKLTASLTDAERNPLPGRQIIFFRSTDGSTWRFITTDLTDQYGTAEATDEIVDYGVYYYKAVFPGDDYYDSSDAVAIYVHTIDWRQLIAQLLTLITLIMYMALILSVAVEWHVGQLDEPL